MEKKIKLFITLSICIIIAIIVSLAIVHRDNSSNKNKKNDVIKEESISLLIIEPDFLNPLVSQNKYVQQVSNLVFDGLTKLDSNLKPNLVLAKTFIPDNTLTKWTVSLRDDVFFHDGSKLTVDDVIFTINKIKELENSYYLYNVSNISSLTKVSDYEFIINLEKSDNFLMSKMDIPILSKAYYENKSLEHTDKYVGTGIYKQTDFSKTNMSLVAFSDYYSKTSGNIKNIEVKIIEKARPGFELLKVGEVDVADTSTDVGAYGRSAYNSKKYVTGIFEGIIFNSENEVLKDPIAREAILLGINRDLIIEEYLGGYGISVDLPVNPNSYLVNTGLTKKSFNPEYAQDILTNNGFKDNLTFGFRTKNENKLQFNLLINKDKENAEEKAEFIKKDLKNIGIDIKVMAKSTIDYNTAIAKKEYDLAITDWVISEYPEFLYSFESNSKDNIFDFSNEDYDYYVFMAKTEYLEGRLTEYFRKMQEILIRELPIMGLYFETSTVYYNKDIEGELNSTVNDIYSGIENMMFAR